MIYSRELFELQWRFATHVAAVAAIPLENALLSYTTFYARFGLGRQFDKTNPVWCNYLEGVRRSATPSDWTYDFYKSRFPDAGAPGIVASVGCFSYAGLSEGRIRLHFHNAETEDVSPLCAWRAEQRREELRGLFEEVFHREGTAVRVIGNSWLYNLSAYRRIFPPAYLANEKPTCLRFNGMPLWGQFLDRRGSVRQDAASTLLRRLSTLTNVQRLAQCFPYQVIALDAVASCFLPISNRNRSLA